MDGGFNHIHEATSKMQRRLHDLERHLTNPLSEERRQQIRHELACLGFELLQREQEDIREQEELSWLEAQFDTEPLDLNKLKEALGGDDGSEP